MKSTVMDNIVFALPSFAFCGYLSSSEWWSSASDVICIYISSVVGFENQTEMVHTTRLGNT